LWSVTNIAAVGTLEPGGQVKLHPFSRRGVSKAVASGVCVLLLVVGGPAAVAAQPWSGIIAPSRATDWRGVGVVNASGVSIDPPSSGWANCTTAACTTLFGGAVNAENIESALASAASAGGNLVVRIPAGTFSVGAFNHQQPNVTLRGAGTLSTKLYLTSTHSGAGFGGDLESAIHLGSATTNSPEFGGITTATWTAGYAQGTTVITRGSTAGLVAGPVGTGSVIFLDQANDSADGFPAAGDLYVCEDDNVGTNCTNQGGNAHARLGRAQVQGVTVTAIAGNQVTIFPPLAMPNWRSSQTPGAWWNASTPLGNAGIENMTLDFTAAGVIAVRMDNCANCWITGLRIINTETGSDASVKQIYVWASVNGTIRSNYLYGKQSTAGFPVNNYAYSDHVVSSMLFENNILHHNVTPIVLNDPGVRNVYAYNYVDDSYTFGAGIQYHSGAVEMALLEGNNWNTAFADIIHGVHYMNTHFRNHHDGQSHNQSGAKDMANDLNRNNRFFNLIANVFGYSGWSIYEESSNDETIVTNDSRVIYLLGWQGFGSGTAITDDNDVRRTLLRWGNWDNVSNAVRFVAGENPSEIPNFQNLASPLQVFPASFYLSGKPSAWWAPNPVWGVAEPPWPPIGPDVTGSALALTGGHAYKIPARLCFENTGDDPDYQSSNPRIKLFDAGTCYFAP